MFKFIKSLFLKFVQKLFIRNKNLEYFCQLSSRLKSPNLKPTTIHTRHFLHKSLFQTFPRIPISQISKIHIYQFINSLIDKNLKPSTIKQILSYASDGFNLAIELKFIKQNPLKSIKFKSTTTKPNKTIPKRHIKKLLKSASSELKTFLYFAFFTGARAGEILAITKNDINYKNNIILISKNSTRFGQSSPKNNKFREVFMPEELKNYLKNIEFKGFKSNYFQIYYEFKKLKKSLKLKINGIHFTRHTYASYCLANQLNPTLIAKILGHRDTTMLTRVYLHSLNNKFELKKINRIYNLSYN